MFKQINILFFFTLLCIQLHAQNLDYAKRVINMLASPEMHGRGYVLKGDSIAAAFIKNEMEGAGLKAFDNNYFQHFNISVNSLPNNAEVKIKNKALRASDDFLIYTPSSGIKGSFKTLVINRNTKQKTLDKMIKKGVGDKILIVDKEGTEGKKTEIYDIIKFYNIFKAKAVITLVDKKTPLTWSVYTGHLLIDFPSIELNKNSIKKIPRKIELNIDNEFHKNYRTQNVIGFVEGSEYPDSFFVFTAHYDHLGRMGKNTFFPGAHDNASGVAMMLDLATFYTENTPKYSIAFIATAAEEAGLLGSEYYTRKPLFPLNNIKFLINLDMVSTGEEGMMVVNGEVFVDDFLNLIKINKEKKYLADIKSRGEAANSDHYYFYKNKVKSFYFYTLGGYSQYHNIYDIPQTLPMSAYNNMFLLITDFINHLSIATYNE